MAIAITEALRISQVLGSVKYRDWAFSTRNVGDYCIASIEYKQEVLPGSGLSKSQPLKKSKPFLIKVGSSEADILFAAITAIGDLEKELMINRLSYKGNMLHQYYMTTDALKRIIEQS